MRGITRLMCVAALAVVSFVVALVHFGDPEPRECRMAAAKDPSYTAHVEDEPSVDLATYHLTLAHGAQPVADAFVCMRLTRGGIGVSNQARPAGPGRYQVAVRLQPAGSWQGVVIVREPARPAVRIPLVLHVP